jgi:aspartyl-tRNA(Asn)/glutamyl-tRNA(Gln) amidotransferase subunit C
MDIETVRKVARLSRLELSEEEMQAALPKLGSIMKFVEQLAEVDTDTVEPLANVVDIKLRLREDEVTDGGIQADVLANAPEALEGFFVVPKVVE